MNDSERLELTALCNALVDGASSADQHRRLNDWLRRSEQARRFYVCFAGLNASLGDHGAEMQSDRRELPPAKPKLIRHPRAWWTGIGAVAASVFAALLFNRSEPHAELGSVAWITGATNARWASATNGPQPGDVLSQGDRLELSSGIAEVTFDSGARVVLEGPASFEVQSAWSGALRSGVATASVPAEAAGFRLTNPEVAVTNLGGDVRIEADPAGAEVVALNGTAEAAPVSRGNRVVLKGRQAHRFSRGNILPVAHLEQKLAHSASRVALGRKGRPLEVVAWNPAQPETKDGSAPAGNARRRNDPFTARARKIAPRTVAFWLRIPADATSEDSKIAEFDHRKLGTIRLAWNTLPEQGPLGALRSQMDVKSLVGKTSLRDSKWHHVALMVVREKKFGRFELKQYVDGRLEGATSFTRRIEPGTSDPAGFVWIPHTRKWRGAFKDGIIADRALTPYELRTLIETNTLAGGA